MSDKPLKVIAGAPDRPLVIGDIQIPCYVLEDETRVLSQRGVTVAIGLNPDAGFRMPQFMASKAISRFVSKELMPALISPIPFKNPAGGGNAYSYPAIILPVICASILEAKNAGKLSSRYKHIAERCWILMQGFAYVGIIALVDEVTGYQEIRNRTALHKLLDKFLLKERARWAKRFPDEFYKQIFKLKGWQWQGMKVNRPSVVGHYTNEIVWDRIAPGVRDELEQRNPKVETGNRLARHHQWLTQDIGHPGLQRHLVEVMAIMRASSNWTQFNRMLQRALPKKDETIPLPLDYHDL